MSQAGHGLAAVEARRVTLAYNRTEDRISLTCALNNGECCVLWLTARLASQLVPNLCQAVTQVPDGRSTNGDPAVTNNDSLISLGRAIITKPHWLAALSNKPPSPRWWQE